MPSLSPNGSQKPVGLQLMIKQRLSDTQGTRVINRPSCTIVQRADLLKTIVHSDIVSRLASIVQNICIPELHNNTTCVLHAVRVSQRVRHDAVPDACAPSAVDGSKEGPTFLPPKASSRTFVCDLGLAAWKASAGARSSANRCAVIVLEVFEDRRSRAQRIRGSASTLKPDPSLAYAGLSTVSCPLSSETLAHR